MFINHSDVSLRVDQVVLSSDRMCPLCVLCMTSVTLPCLIPLPYHLLLMLKWVFQVEDVYFPKERATGRRRPFCFVTFASQQVLFRSDGF